MHLTGQSHQSFLFKKINHFLWLTENCARFSFDLDDDQRLAAERQNINFAGASIKISRQNPVFLFQQELRRQILPPIPQRLSLPQTLLWLWYHLMFPCQV